MMRKIILATLAAGAAFAATASPALAWEHLGTRHVRDAVDHDSIALPGTRKFDRIRICAYGRPVHFIDLKVHFANGGTQDVPVRAVVRPGTCTRSINLVGDDRNISSVHFVYEANTRRRFVGAEVRLFGE
jgi:hypothetical protein